MIGKADGCAFASFYLAMNVMEDRDLLRHALSYVSLGGSFADVGLHFADRGIASCIIGVPFVSSLFYVRFTLK